MPLSCFSHIKRTLTDDGTVGDRPPAPGVAVFTEFNLDRSGSMCSYDGAQHEATKKLFAQQKKSAKETGIPHFFTVATFDDDAKVYLNNIDAANAEPPTDAQLAEMCDPRGCTKLYDTALQGVKRLEKRAREWYNSQSPSFRRLVSFDQVTMTFMLFTDGYDNASTLDRDGQMLYDAIRDFRSLGGTAIFMAANQDACTVGVNLGFDRDTSLTVGTTPEYAQAAFDGVTQLLRARSGGQRVMSVPSCLRQSSCPQYSYSDDSDDANSDLSQLLSPSTTLNGRPPIPNLRSSAVAALAAANTPPPIVRSGIRQSALVPPPLPRRSQIRTTARLGRVGARVLFN